MVSNEQQNMDIGYKAEFRLIRTDYRRYSSLNKSGGRIHLGIALDNAIMSLLRNDTALDEMARNIQNDYFVGDKSWKVIAEKYVAFYGRKIN